MRANISICKTDILKGKDFYRLHHHFHQGNNEDLYPDEDLHHGSKYCFSLNVSKYKFGFPFVVWRWFFFTRIILFDIDRKTENKELSKSNLFKE